MIRPAVLTSLTALTLIACSHKTAPAEAPAEPEPAWDPLADVEPFTCGPERTPGKVGAFHPNAPIALDKYGSGPRPDEDQLLQILSCRYEAMDACVVAVKAEMQAEAEAGTENAPARVAGSPGTEPASDPPSTEPAPAPDPSGALGYARLQVLLDPAGEDPMGVNVHVPESLAQRESFVECLRTATAAAPYPTYDGPPVVVDFEIELGGGDMADEDVMANGPPPGAREQPVSTDNFDAIFD